jgi:hypothetical protein
MSNLKKQLKKLQQQQKKLNEVIRLEQATCPHIGKNGKTKLVPFVEDEVRKGRCKKCGEVVILDSEYLTQDILSSSADVIKTALAEVRAAVHVGKIKLDDETMRMISTFDAEVLRELPSTIADITRAGSKKDKKKKDKGKGKKGKKSKKKNNKRERWN